MEPKFCKVCGEKLITKDISQGEWYYFSEDTGEKLTYKKTQTVCPNYKETWNIFKLNHHTLGLIKLQLYNPNP